MEANHRHLMAEFADWLENVRKPKAPLPQNFQHTVTPSTRYELKTPLPTWTTSTTKSPRFQRDTDPHHTQHTSRPKHHQQPRQTAMPTDNLADAFYLGNEIPMRPRNPYSRGTPKHLKRQNINRNIRLHLRNDRKHVQEDFSNNKQAQETHFVFYRALSDFAQWDHTRQLLPHDATLIRQWTKAYRKGKRAILRMDTMFDAHHCVQTMTRLLVQHVKRTLRAAESGTLVRRPIALTYPWQTPLNQARMDHFCTHLHALLMDPLTTPDFTEPILDVANLQCYGDIISDILQDAEETLSAMD
jgi:hypothetical protein